MTRHRSTSEEMDQFRSELLRLGAELWGDDGSAFTLRQFFYRCTVRGLIAKDEREYKRLAAVTSEMRKCGQMPLYWFEDGTRLVTTRKIFESPLHAIQQMANEYAESPWTSSDTAPEIWLEKDALAGVIVETTLTRYVPLRVMRGYASLTALHVAEGDILARARNGISTIVLQLGDYDPSGQDAIRAAREFIQHRLRGTPASEAVSFQTLGLTIHQVREWELPTRPTKLSDTRAKNHVGECVELDALPPKQLIGLVRYAIEDFLPEQARLTHEAQVNSTAQYLAGLRFYLPAEMQ